MPLELTELKPCGAFTIDNNCLKAIPVKCANKNCIQFEMPTDVHPELEIVIQEFEGLFSKQLGQTNVTRKVIDTGEATPIKSTNPLSLCGTGTRAARRHGQGRNYSSPWSAPAVYVPKSSGEVRICVDFVKLNQVTKKDSYPVP